VSRDATDAPFATPVDDSCRGYFSVLLFGCRSSTYVIALHPLLRLDAYPYLASFLRPVSLSRGIPIGSRSWALQVQSSLADTHCSRSYPKYNLSASKDAMHGLGKKIAFGLVQYNEQVAGMLLGQG
jgi:hypothetical protein